MYYSVPKISLIFSSIGINHAVHPTVDLSYASYRGQVSPSVGVSFWQGMRYAAAPLGDLRFAAPQDPPKVSGVQDAYKPGPYCLAVGGGPPVDGTTSEDCLFLDVYAPSNATKTSNLPVFVFIQGGGFSSNANANFNGRGLVQASGRKMVVVTFNYRVGAFGFISGSDVPSPNNGLKDQRKVLEWVQNHISAFGGNPKHVVIGGDSAGASSVGFHLTAYGGRNDSLFHAAAAESVSFPTILTVKESQYLYDDLVGKVGCKGSNSLSCLRKVPIAQLQKNITTVPYPGTMARPLYSWIPVIDGELIQDYTYRAFNSGKFLHVPTIFGDDTNGGTIFAPRNTNSLADSDGFLRTQFPYMTDAQVEILNKLYPNDPKQTYPDSGAYWRQLSNVYGDMRYMCPGLFLNNVFVNHKVPTWSYRYNVQDPDQVKAGLGVPHTVEVNAIFGPGNVGGASMPRSYLPGESNSQIVSVIQGYWTSFIKNYDPTVGRKKGSAIWDQYDTTRMNRLLFDTPVDKTRMEHVDDSLRGKCEYLWGIGVDLKQ